MVEAFIRLSLYPMKLAHLGTRPHLHTGQTLLVAIALLSRLALLARYADRTHN